MSEINKDPFAQYSANPLEQIPWASDNKEPDALLKEFLAGPPPMYRGRRVPFVVFHKVMIDKYPDGPQYKTVRKNTLLVLQCHGTNAQTSVIQQNAMESRALLYYWFPEQNPKPRLVSVVGGYETYIHEEPAEPYRELEAFCERMKGVGQDNQQLRAEKEALEKKVKELEAQTSKRKKEVE